MAPYNVTVLLCIVVLSITGCECITVSTTTCTGTLIETTTYQKTCCQAQNYGKSFIIDQADSTSIIMCPTTGPAVGCIGSGTSCHDISINYPNSSSGYYDIALHNGSVISVYCHMEGDNCDGEGGWTRVGYINMTESDSTCPSVLSTHVIYSVTGSYKTCYSSSAGCASIAFSTGYNYTQVCGQARGFAEYTFGFWYSSILPENHNNINLQYTDGISITKGNDTRHHIWTYAVADHPDDCACNASLADVITPPTFINSDYYCDIVNDITSYYPLWDGKDCNPNCCHYPNQPWFLKTLDEESDDDIEVRLCSYDAVSGRVYLNLLDIFVK